MTGVQLIGKNAVITRFEKLGCGSWALYQGKQFIVADAGSDTLNEWLSDFDVTGSTATYILRAYDSETPPTCGTANNDYIACIQFKLTDNYEGYGIAGHSNKLMDRIKGLEDQIKKLEKPDIDDDDEGMSIGAVVSDWLQNPEKLAVVFGIAKQIFTGGSGYTPSPQPIQSISGMAFNTQTVSASSSEGLERISKALDILGTKDPDIVVHLEKLAKLAQDNPDLFKMVVSNLDKL